MRRAQLRVRQDNRPEFRYLKYSSIASLVCVTLLVAGLMLWRGVPPPESVEPVAAKPTVANNQKRSLASISSWFQLSPCSAWYSSDQLYALRLECQMQTVRCSPVYIIYVEELPNVRTR